MTMGDLEAPLIKTKSSPAAAAAAEHIKGTRNRGSREIPKSSALIVILSTLVVAFGPITFGFSLGFTSPTQQEITEDLNLTVSQFSWYGALVNVGAMLGALASGSIADAFGRKWALVFASIPHISGWILNALSTDIALLYAARLLVGFGVGVISFTVPMYIAEIAPSHLRGSLGTVNQLSVTIGIFLSYFGGLFLKWRVLALAGIFPCCIMLVGIPFISETPRWLAKKGDEARLRSSLETLRGKDYNIEGEFLQIQEAVRTADQASACFSDIFRRDLRRPLLIAIGLQILQQFGGINAIMFYSSSIFSSAGFTSSNLASFSLSSLQVLATAVAAGLMDKAGRRILLLISAGGMAACCFLVGLSFYLQDKLALSSHPVLSTFVSNLSLLSLLIYIAAFSLGLGPIPWILMSEIFPSRVSGKAGSAATAANWTGCFIVTMTFNFLLDWSSTGSFVIFGAECLFTVFFVWILVPETKGKTLEEIQESFHQ